MAADDPVRPWKETGPGGDKQWYSSWSTDGCNKTGGDGTQKTPCKPGGQLELLSAPTLRGPWKQLAPMFTTNVTCSAGQCKHGAIEAEFVTSGYFGGVAGDPDGGATRVVTQNRAGPTFWVGTITVSNYPDRVSQGVYNDRMTGSHRANLIYF